MPAINVYLNDSEYVKLAYLAMRRQAKVTHLIREAVKRMLAEEGREKMEEKVVEDHG